MIRKFIFALAVMILIFMSSESFCASRAEFALERLTLEQKVGQLFIIRPEQVNPKYKYDDTTGKSVNDKSKKKKDDFNYTVFTEEMRTFMKNYPAGGFAIFARNIESPEQLKRLTRDLNDASIKLLGVPAIMAIDEEGGRVARIANSKVIDVAKVQNMAAIGKTKKESNARRAGEIIGKYLKEYGFNLNFAPVVDVNTNPKNIVIGNRAFGSTPSLVSRMAGAYIDGLHAYGIGACLKHFPGHGDTRGDTHKGTVNINKTWKNLRKVELIPFTENFKKAEAVMSAHVTMRKVTNDGLPASLSKAIITDKLRKELGYEGLIITDALEMSSVTKKWKPGRASLMAFEAGNDIILLPVDYRAAYHEILNAVKKGRISEKRLNESVLRILEFKFSHM